MTNVLVGPVAQESTLAWLEWVHAAMGELRDEPDSPDSLRASVVEHFDAYLRTWHETARRCHGEFRWHAEVDPDHLEYLLCGLHNLDTRLAMEVSRGERPAPPAEARTFGVVLVRALLTALAHDGPTRASYADELRLSWATASDSD